jgi:hypothetical protein
MKKAMFLRVAALLSSVLTIALAAGAGKWG